MGVCVLLPMYEYEYAREAQIQAARTRQASADVVTVICDLMGVCV